VREERVDDRERRAAESQDIGDVPRAEVIPTGNRSQHQYDGLAGIHLAESATMLSFDP
jgi:hypothetical protein